jgi:hypothetical protein
MRVFRLYYARDDAPIARSMAAVLFAPFFQILFQPMSNLFDLGEPGENLLLLWTRRCTVVNAADWLELLDADLKSNTGRCLGVIQFPAHNSALATYLQMCGARRLFILSFVADVYGGELGQFKAKPIRDRSLRRKFNAVLRHGGRVSQDQLAKYVNILPGITNKLPQ